MNLQQIEYALAVAELRSFGKAAKRCFIAQSTLSTMIARFEDEIGVQLFDRKTKPVTVTQEGEIILEQLKRLSVERKVLDEVIHTVVNEWAGSLSLGIIPTVASSLLPRFLQGFASAHPDVHLHVSEYQTQVLIDLLERRELDMAIAATPLRHKGLVEHELYHEPFVRFDYRMQGQVASTKLDDIPPDAFWLLEESHCLHTQVKEICAPKLKQPTQRNLDFRSGSIDSLVRFVKAVRGVTLLPLMAAKDLDPSYASHIYPIAGDTPMRTISIIVHERYVKHGLLAQMRRHIQQAVAGDVAHPSEGYVVSPI